MIARSKPLKKCPHCNKPAFRRGVCRGCYFQAKRRIKARETTDEKLVKGKWWKPSQRGGRSPVAEKLDAAIAAGNSK